eukprot:5345408-Prorocentrum_lima.AAC.1
MCTSSARADSDDDVIGDFTNVQLSLLCSGTYDTVQPFNGPKAKQGWYFTVLEYCALEREISQLPDS